MLFPLELVFEWLSPQERSNQCLKAVYDGQFGAMFVSCLLLCDELEITERLCLHIFHRCLREDDVFALPIQHLFPVLRRPLAILLVVLFGERRLDKLGRINASDCRDCRLKITKVDLEQLRQQPQWRHLLTQERLKMVHETLILPVCLDQEVEILVQGVEESCVVELLQIRV